MGFRAGQVVVIEAGGGAEGFDVTVVEFFQPLGEPGVAVADDEGEQVGQGMQVFTGVVEIDLSRVRDRWIYAKYVTMPTVTSWCGRTSCDGGLLAPGAGRNGRHSCAGGEALLRLGTGLSGRRA